VPDFSFRHSQGGTQAQELLAHEPESPQAQAPQSDLMLQFREQGFHLLSLPLCFGELWRVDQLPRPLSGWFILVDDKAETVKRLRMGAKPNSRRENAIG